MDMAKTSPPDAVRPFLIGDKWSYGQGKTFESICPIDGSVAATIAEADADDVSAAVASARAALQDSRWAGLRVHQRARLLYRMAELIERDAEQLAQIQTRDNGKTIGESRLQAAGAAETFRYYAAVCEVAESEMMSPRGNYMSFSVYEPIGVVAAITPWNSPLTQEAVKLAPALAAGNAVILKPSEVTPQIALEFGRLALEAGFPPGVLNVLTGHGQVGRALVSHPGVDMVTFTGGTASGREVGKIAGERIIPATLELGGKSPNIIFADVDLEQAVKGAIYGLFPNAGQSCIAGSRIFVQDEIYDQFVPRLVEAASRLRVGDPYDRLTAVAPVGSFVHRDRIESYVNRARQEGAVVLCGGERPTDGPLARGAYVAPTVLAVSDNNATVAQEEIFGPVACVLRFKDEEDLIRQANDTVFGLACGIWTRDYKRALRVAGKIKAGTVWINTFRTIMLNMPFGGYKSSGIGRECGIQGMREYMEQKSIYMDLAETPVPWPPV